MPSRKKRVSPKKKEADVQDSDSSVSSSPKPEKKAPQPKAKKAPAKNAPAASTKKKAAPARAAPQKKKAIAVSSNKKSKNVEVDEKKPRAPRKKITMENYIEKCDELLALLDAEVERKQKEREKGTRVFRSIRKTVR